MSTNICIIPARGGSKRIPRKNIKNFNGEPIIAYSIQAALDTKVFDCIMVSTDDNEIKEIAQNYGAEVPFLRSSQTSNDNATTFEVISEVIASYAEENLRFENICCLYPCAPLVTPKLLKEGLTHLKSGFDSVFPVLEFNKPIQRALKIENNRIKMVNPSYLNVRTQDLEKTYYDAGQFYWLKMDQAMKKGEILTDNSKAMILSESDAHDIDDMMDWNKALHKYIEQNRPQ